MLKERYPCLITSYCVETAEQGPAKVVITGTDIFTNRTYEQTLATNEQVCRPIVTEKEYSCGSVEGNALVLSTPELEVRRDLLLPNESHLLAVKQSI